jgi:methyl-accepting chemotaxis protein
MATIRDRYILEVDTVGGVRSMGNAAAASGRLSGALGGIRGVAGIAAGALAAVGAGAFIRNVAEATAEMQDLTTTLETVTGSAEGAQNALDFINDFATTTPFDIQNLTEAFIRLENAGIAPTRDLMTTLGDAAAVSTDKVGALEAVTQLFARSVQGGLGLEDLDRLADRGINVYGIIREELGLTRQEISEFGKTAEGAAEIQQALLAGFEREYGGGMARAADNLSTSLSNMGIAANNALIAVGEGGLAEGLQYASEFISSFLVENEELATMLGEVLGDAIRGIVDLIDGLITAFEEGGPQVDFLKTSFNALGDVFIAVFEAIGPIKEALEPLANIIFPALGEVIEFVAGVLVTLVEGFADFVTGISEAITSADSFGEAVTGAFSSIYDTVVGVVSSLVTQVTDLFQGLYDALWGNSIIKDLINGIVEGFTGLDVDLIGIIDTLVQNVIDAFGRLFGNIVDGIGGAIEAGLDRVSEAYQAFKDRFFGDSEDIEDAADNTRSALEQALEGEGLTAAAVAAASEEVANLADSLNTVTPLIEDHAEDLEGIAESYESISESIETLNELMEEYTEAVEDLNDAKDNEVEYAEELVELYGELNPLLETAKTHYSEMVDNLVVINENMASLVPTLEENTAGYENLTDVMDSNITALEDQVDATAELGDELINVQDGVNAYLQGLTTMFEMTNSNISATEQLTASLARMASQAERAQITAQRATQALNAQAEAAQAAVAPQSTQRGTQNALDRVANFFNGFAGGFQTGGYIPSGQFGLVGEAGPELISGPAQITPLDAVGSGANQNITYNINATDARSFRELVARDPGFIHAVAQRGASAIPGGRR